MIAAATCDSLLLRRRLSCLYETTCTCTSRCHHLTNCHCQLSVRLILQVALIRVSIGTRLHCQQTSTPSITVDLQSNFAADWDWLSCGFRPAFHSTQNRLNSQLLQISSIYRIFQCLTTALDFLCIALFGHVKPAIIETRIWMKSLKSAESANSTRPQLLDSVQSTDAVIKVCLQHINWTELNWTEFQFKTRVF